jgi:hypothetical protein
MTWQEGVAVTVVLLGLGALAFLVAQRPSFWIEFGTRLGKALLPLAWRYVSKRMPPEEEAAWRQAERRGHGEEWLKQRCRVRRKTQT